MRKFKRLFSLVLAFVLAVTPFVSQASEECSAYSLSFSGQTSSPKEERDGVYEALLRIKEAYPSKCKYFTASGNPCDDEENNWRDPDAQVENIPARGDLPSGTDIANFFDQGNGGRACSGFAQYVWWMVFGEDYHFANRVKTPSLGDVLITSNPHTKTSHASIFLWEDDGYWYVFDCNSGGTCYVRYGGGHSKERNELDVIYHATNYDYVVKNGSPILSANSGEVVPDGTYYIKNKANGLYLSTDYQVDDRGVTYPQTVKTRPLGAVDGKNQCSFKISLERDRINDELQMDRYSALFDVDCLAYGEPIVSHMLIRATGGASDESLVDARVYIGKSYYKNYERWQFEKVDGGFVIKLAKYTDRNMVLTSCENNYVKLMPYTGADNQIWNLNCTVEYDANGGEGAPEKHSRDYDEKITLSTKKLTRPDYEFLGWATRPDATVPEYLPGEAYTKGGSAKLYAVWVPGPLTVTFRGWDGSVLSTQTVKYNAAAVAPEIPQRDGYVFVKWDTAFDKITCDTTVTAFYAKSVSPMIDTPTYTAVLTENGDGTATLVATVPEGVCAGKLVIYVSDDLEFISGSIKSVAGAARSENYGDGICVSFASATAYPEGTVVLKASYKINEGATLDVDDFRAYKWELFDSKKKLGWERDGDVYKLVTEKTYKIGDANKDGCVDSIDAAQILRYDAGLISEADILKNFADINGDGVVDGIDASIILKFDSGLIERF